MSTESLVDALEREHQQIDHAIDDFLSEGGDATALLGAITALRRHIYLEEEYLFPALPDPALAAPVFVMLREHAQMWRLLDALDDVLRTRDDRSEAARLCKQLSIQLQHHNQKEERILYTAAATTIPTELTDRIRGLIHSTPEAPSGWVCIKTRNTGEGSPSSV